MKTINFPSSDDFVLRPCSIGDEPCVLVFPKNIGVKWNNENKFFRSSIWTWKDRKLISAGFRKFTNLGESPEFEPLNSNDKGLSYVRKIDGSCLVVSKFKNELIVRTRGTVDAEESMENGDEIPLLKEKYPKVFNNEFLNSENYSILLEWFSPRNLIVEVESNEPDIWLIGIVNHEDYSYFPQDKLDALGKSWEIKRPERYSFKTVEDMVNAVKIWEKGEGVVIYSGNGQILKKVKADPYLIKHKLKSELNSENRFIDFYILEGMPEYQDFFDAITRVCDYETAQAFIGRISNCVEGGKEVKRIIDGMTDFVREIRNFNTRKEQALAIQSAYGQTNRAGMVFKILDNKGLEKDDLVKLMWQVLKK